VRAHKNRYRAFTASLTGTALEYYDFAVYSSAAALILAHLYFPSDDPTSGLIQAFGTYAVGYLARPIGGVVFGRLGDIAGRKKVLVWTLLLVGMATFLIGLLPTHEQIGAAAPAILVLLRFAQGVGVGGEWGGAVLLSSEFGDEKRRGLWASAAQVGPPLGTLLANGVLALLITSLSEEQFLAWGWRLAFLASVVLIGLGLWVRASLDETPVFRYLEDNGERAERPLKEVFAMQKRALLAAMLARLGPDVLYAMFAVFVLTYATVHLGLSRGHAVTAVLVGSALQAPMIPFAGYLSDVFGRRTVYAIGATLAAIWAVTFFSFARDETTLLIGVAVALLLHSLMYGPQAAYICEQFDVRVRSTASALAYTLAGLFGGAIAPMIFSWMLSKPDMIWAIGAYIAAACTITLAGLLLGREAARVAPERQTEAVPE
jgi:MFS family permease